MEKTKVRVTYKLYISGNDLDAKAAQKLKAGDELKLVRLDDELDTYEILITTREGKELDMLSYQESIGIAPFLDNGDLNFISATVVSSQVNPGKTRAKDETVVAFDVLYEYDHYSNCQAKCNSLVEKVNRRNKVKTFSGAIVNQIKNSIKALS